MSGLGPGDSAVAAAGDRAPRRDRTDLRAVYTPFTRCDFPAQLVASASGPNLVLSEDLRPAAEDSASGYRPLEKPHYEVHLDGVRPLVVEALLPAGERPRKHVGVPLSLDPDESARIVVTPVTTLSSCIGWRLLIRWQEDGADLYAAWDLRVTGNTCWTVSAPGGARRFMPVARLGHWDPHSYYQGGHSVYNEHLTMTAQTNPAWLEAVRRPRNVP